MFRTWAVRFLLLEACCCFETQTCAWTFSACGWTSSLSTVYTGSTSLTICSVTASITAANVGCLLVGVCGLQRSCAVVSCSEQMSHCDTCVCLRWWNKCVGPLPLVATAFEQTLQWTVVCSRSDATKSNYWRDGAFLGTNSWLASRCCVCSSVETQCGGQSLLWTTTMGSCIFLF